MNDVIFLYGESITKLHELLVIRSLSFPFACDAKTMYTSSAESLSIEGIFRSGRFESLFSK